MMEFLVIAYDGTDEGALERRMKVREAHLAQARRLKKDGHLIEGRRPAESGRKDDWLHALRTLRYH